MPKYNKKSLTLAIIVVCIVGIVGIKFIIHSTRSQDQSVAMARVKGNPKAKLKIVEFVDFQCPACAKGAMILKSLLDVHGKDVSLELKYFPLRMHQHAFQTARYAECSSRQKLFWPFIEDLFAQQSQWSNLNDIDADLYFQKLAKDKGVNLTALNICLKEDSVDQVLLKNKEEGTNLDVKSTPTYFINNKMIVGTKDLLTEMTTAFPDFKFDENPH